MGGRRRLHIFCWNSCLRMKAGPARPLFGGPKWKRGVATVVAESPWFAPHWPRGDRSGGGGRGIWYRGLCRRVVVRSANNLFCCALGSWAGGDFAQVRRHSTGEHNSAEFQGNTGVDHVWSFGKRGLDASKRILIMGGVHGNELVGINVVRRLVEGFESGSLLCPDSHEGRTPSVVLAIGNPAAVKLGTRGSMKGGDLNREFPLKVLEQARSGEDDCGSFEERRARALCSVIARSDYLVDLHATNLPSPPFIRIGGFVTKERLNLASWFIGLDNPGAPSKEPTLLLVDPGYQIGCGNPCTTDEFSTQMGNVAVCVETGHADDTSMENEVYRRVLTMLGHMAGVTQVDETGTEHSQAGDQSTFIFSPYDEEQGVGMTMSEALPSFGERKFVLVDDSMKVSTFTLMQRYAHVFRTYELQPPRVLQAGELEPDSPRKFSFVAGIGGNNWQRIVSPVEKWDEKQGVNDNNKYEDKETVIVFPKAAELQIEGKPVYWLADRLAVDFYHWGEPEQVLSKKASKGALKAYLSNARKQNFSYFIPLVLGHPVAFDRQKGDPKLRIKSSATHRWDDEAVGAAAAADKPPPIGRLKVKTLTSVTDNAIVDSGFAIPHVLRALQKWLGKAQGPKRRLPNRVVRQMCYVPPEFSSVRAEAETVEERQKRDDWCARPVLVFPSSYIVNQDYFRKGMAPFFSSRLVLPSNDQVRRIQRKNCTYLGLPPIDSRAGELAREMSEGEAIEYDGATFVPVRLYGASYFLTVQADTAERETCLVIVGDSVEDVGQSYHSLMQAARALYALAGRPGQAAEFHPTFSRLGETVSWYGFKLLLDDASVKIDLEEIDAKELDRDLQKQQHEQQTMGEPLVDTYSYDYS